MKMQDKIDRQKSQCPSGDDITAYLCNELQAEESREIQVHIDSCSACKKLADEITESLKLLGVLKKMPTVPDIVPAVMERIATNVSSADNPPFWRILLLRRILYIAASIVGVIAVIYGLIHIKTKERVVVATTSVQNVADITKYRQTGIRWLVKAQEADGRWEPVRWGGKQEYTVGLTAISLLAVIETEDEFPEKNICIQRASEFLLKQQHKDGRFGEYFDGTMYNHGIATVALLELYRKNKKAELEQPLKSALAFIRQNQLATGGWAYFTRPQEVANTSVSTWPLLALFISYDTGWKDTDHSINRAVQWLVGLIDEQGQFGYERRGSSPYGTEALTAMGAYCLLKAETIGIKINSHIMEMAKQKLAIVKKADNADDFYKTYFQICVFKEIGESMHNNMISLQTQLIARIRQTGPEKGSWDPIDRWGTTGGRIYSTALALMSL